MEHPQFEDVFPIQDGDFPLLCLFTGGYIIFVPPTWEPFNLVDVPAPKNSGLGRKLGSWSPLCSE